MGRKRTPGLYKRGNIWHIDKKVFGHRLCESTGSDSLEEAEHYVAKRLEELRLTVVYGVRPKRLFREAATKYLQEHQYKASISSDTHRLKILNDYIGDISLDLIHMGTLQSFITARREQGIKSRTINHGLKVVRYILNLAASEWIDENGLTWLASAPKIKLLPEPDLRKPYPLSWEEQARLFAVLPAHLAQMALFAVNTGCRDTEICSLRWEWEIPFPELNTSVFVIPGEIVKNREDRLVVLNKVAAQVVEEVRGKHPTFVFTFRNKPITRMLNSGWKTAREKAGLAVRVHDLKHTFGRRLRAAGVSYEDRQDLLGHKSGRITTHYSAAELKNLIDAANTVCQTHNGGLVLTLLKRGDLAASSRKNPATDFCMEGNIVLSP
jgi:integrase